MSRQLDAAIAEALGNSVQKNIDDYWQFKGNYFYRRVPKYSTDGNDMLELDREMRARGYKHHIHSVSGYRGDEKVEELEVVFYKNHNEQVTAWRSEKEMPMIFAKQAYKALTGKEWGEGE